MRIKIVTIVYDTARVCFASLAKTSVFFVITNPFRGVAIHRGGEYGTGARYPARVCFASLAKTKNNIMARDCFVALLLAKTILRCSPHG